MHMLCMRSSTQLPYGCHPCRCSLTSACRGVAMLTLLKASGAMVWAAAVSLRGSELCVKMDHLCHQCASAAAQPSQSQSLQLHAADSHGRSVLVRVSVRLMSEPASSQPQSWQLMTAPESSVLVQDIMNVKYAVLPSMQALGDEQVTLGWIFAAVGIGCLIGPIGANWMTEPECGPLNPTLEVATIVKSACPSR